MQSIVRKLEKFRALPWPEKKVLLGSMLLLPIFRLGLRAFGFARFQAWLDRSSHAAPFPVHVEPGELTAIGRLVNIAARHTPGTITCLTRSLFLRWLLRRRGIASELRIGVHLAQGKLDAHAWVEYAGKPINDAQDVAERFAAFNQPLSPESFS